MRERICQEKDLTGKIRDFCEGESEQGWVPDMNEGMGCDIKVDS